MSMAVERSRPPAEVRPETDVGEARELLTEARSRMPWLAEGSQVAQQQMLREYSRSLEHSFTVKGRGRPVFARAKRLELHERGFACSFCGFTDSRDRNAAKTILVVAERGHTSVDDMRQAGHLLRVDGQVAV
ncbi:hypothetical protein [Nocardia sp. NPDC005366]|uniref:hypothetical protein n=1 Tax=Nocardia sp. NPDC005366 TaxID=3156878 RepID=UPI0033A8002D